MENKKGPLGNGPEAGSACQSNSKNKGQLQYTTVCTGEQSPAATIWREIAHQIELTRPRLAREHQLDRANARFNAAGDLCVTLPQKTSAAALAHFAATATRPLEVATRFAGQPALRILFVDQETNRV